MPFNLNVSNMCSKKCAFYMMSTGLAGLVIGASVWEACWQSPGTTWGLTTGDCSMLKPSWSNVAGYSITAITATLLTTLLRNCNIKPSAPSFCAKKPYDVEYDVDGGEDALLNKNQSNDETAEDDVKSGCCPIKFCK